MTAFSVEDIEKLKKDSDHLNWLLKRVVVERVNGQSVLKLPCGGWKISAE